MKNGLLYLLFIFFSCTESSQKFSKKDIDYIEVDKETGWFRVHNKKNKWGFIDKDSSIVIPFEYDFLNPFDDNQLAYGKNKGKEFFIDTKGALIIKPIYEKLGLFSEGLVEAKKNGKTGYLNTKGEIVIPFLYENQASFYKRLAVVSKGNRFGFINKRGKEIIPIIYDGAQSQQLDDIVIVQKNKKWAFFDNEGKQLSDFLFDEIFRTDHYDFSQDIFDRSQSTYFKNGAVLVRKGKNYEFLNEKIEPAFPNNKFDSATAFDTYQNAIVKRNGKYGMIKPDGNLKVPLEYDLIDSQNKILIPFGRQFISEVFDKFDEKPRESPNYFIVENKTTSKIVDINNKTIINGYQSIRPIFYDHSKLLVKKNNKFGVIDFNNKILSPIIYDEFSDWIEYGPEDRHIVKVGSKSGMLEEKTFKVKIPVVYDFVFISRYVVFVEKNKKYGIIDLDNKILCPMIYDELKPNFGYGLGFGDDKIYARKTNQYFEIDINGKIVKSVTKTKFIEESKEPEPPPPPPKIK